MTYPVSTEPEGPITDDNGDELEHGESDFPGQFPEVSSTPEDPLRTCRYCGVTRPLDEFHNHGNHIGYRCRDCRRPMGRRHTATYQETHREQELQRARLRGNDPKIQARETLRYAVRRGLVIRPSTCQSCRVEARVYGHHDDYSRPLDVRWLCRLCHEEVHRQMRRAQKLSA